MYRQARKINIDADPHVTGGLTGGVGQPLEFDVDKPAAFEINRRMFQSDAAPGTMFHEVTHVSDYELAQRWVRTYQDETHRLFVGGVGPGPGKTQTPFEEWLSAQVPKRLSQADAELVRNEANGDYSTSEARANIRTFLLSLQSGAPESRTTDQLASYVGAMKPGGSYQNPIPGSFVTAELVQELKTAYREMPPAMRHQFEAALAAAKSANPNAWVSKIDLGK
jgi:hypothetical protein